jgi:Cu2+-exporting ATPase
MLTGDNEATTDRHDAGHRRSSPRCSRRTVCQGRGLQAAGRRWRWWATGQRRALTADLGIAIGAGTDVAIETADVVLMRSDPLDVAIALRIGKGTVRKMRQNLGWAIGYNAIALPIAAGVFAGVGLMLSPEIAAISMSGSSASPSMRFGGCAQAKRSANCPVDTREPAAAEVEQGI